MTDIADTVDAATTDLHEVAARLPALVKLRRDLAYRTPAPDSRPLKNIALTREQAIEVLELCEKAATAEPPPQQV
jgi:hypothetical protein